MCCRLSSYEVKAVVARKKHTDYQNFTLFMNNKEYTVHVGAVGDQFFWLGEEVEAGFILTAESTGILTNSPLSALRSRMLYNILILTHLLTNLLHRMTQMH